jgi:cobalt-zinc-cadmium efflux system membrane fusion protein
LQGRIREGPLGRVGPIVARQLRRRVFREGSVVDEGSPLAETTSNEEARGPDSPSPSEQPRLTPREPAPRPAPPRHAGTSSRRFIAQAAETASRKTGVGQVIASLAAIGALAFLGHFLKERAEQRDANLLPPIPQGQQSGPKILTLPRDSAKLSLVKTARVERRAIPLEVRVPGKIQVNGDALVRMNPPVSGRIVEVNARPGQRVAKGDTLFVIDSPDVGSAQADVVKSQADLEVARKNAARTQELATKGVVAGADLEQAKADLAKAEAEAARAKKRLDQLGLPEGTIGQRVPVRAPFAGSIIDRPANLGEEVRSDATPSLVLATIADLSSVWAAGDLYESALANAPELAKFSSSQRKLPVIVEVPALRAARYEGTLDYVSDTVDPTTVTLRVRSTIPNPERQLRPEMAAIMLITVDRERMETVLPEGALLPTGAGEIAIVQSSEGVFERRAVKSGRRGSGLVAVTGVKEGESVVVEGAAFLNSELEAAKD